MLEMLLCVMMSCQVGDVMHREVSKIPRYEIVADDTELLELNIQEGEILPFRRQFVEEVIRSTVLQ